MESTSTTEADKKTITLLKQQLNEEIESFRDKSNTIKNIRWVIQKITVMT